MNTFGAHVGLTRSGPNSTLNTYIPRRHLGRGCLVVCVRFPRTRHVPYRSRRLQSHPGRCSFQALGGLLEEFPRESRQKSKKVCVLFCPFAPFPVPPPVVGRMLLPRSSASCQTVDLRTQFGKIDNCNLVFFLHFVVVVKVNSSWPSAARHRQPAPPSRGRSRPSRPRTSV